MNNMMELTLKYTHRGEGLEWEVGVAAWGR